MKDQTTNDNQSLLISHHISLTVNKLPRQHELDIKVAKEDGINGILNAIDKLQQDVSKYLTIIVEEKKIDTIDGTRGTS